MSDTEPNDQQRAAALQEQGKLPEAEALLRTLVQGEPGNAQAHHNLGAVLARQGRSEEAVACFAAAIELDPTYFSARRNLARVLGGLNRPAEAAAQLQHVLAAAPDDVEALVDLGTMLCQANAPGEAAVVLRHARRLKPDSSDIHNSLGLALLAAGQFATAEAAFEEALRLAPEYAAAHVNLATSCKEQGRLREALANYNHGLRLEPDNASTHWNKALLQLQMGDFEQGWAEYEWRFRRPASPPRKLDKPLWDGSDLGGKTILLYGEQGLGDTVQFARYAALAKAAGARVMLECQSPLIGMMAGCEGIDQLLIEGQAHPPYDVHLPLLSCPHRFRNTLANIPNRVPYLHIDPAAVEHWRQRLGNDGSFRVGIAWQGNPHHQLDRFRSVPLPLFRALMDIPRLKLISLQRGPGSEQLDDPSNRTLGVNEVTGRQVTTAQDWIDTAAIMRNLDLVITVDTATAHVAGALGAPVWLIISAAPDWRWMLKRTDSPWYPTTRLFRQDELGKWEPLFEKMAAELRDRVQRRTAIRVSLQEEPLGIPPAPIAERSLAALPKLLTVLIGCYGDYPQYSLRALESIASGNDLAKHCELMIGLNECTQPTTDRARELLDRKVAQAVIESPRNINKDPMMRVLLEMVQTPYVLWMDDDSYFLKPDWPQAFAAAVAAAHIVRPFDAAGHVHYWGPQRGGDLRYMDYVRQRPWWRGDDHYPPERLNSVRFPLGGLYIARSDFLRRHDYPDRGMIKGLDDVLLGELVLQAGGRLLAFDQSLLDHIKINDGQRRGQLGEEIEGASQTARDFYTSHTSLG